MEAEAKAKIVKKHVLETRGRRVSALVQERSAAHRHLFGKPDAPSLASASLSGEVTEELLVAASPSEMLEHTVANLEELLGQYEEADELHKAIKVRRRALCLANLTSLFLHPPRRTERSTRDGSEGL